MYENVTKARLYFVIQYVGISIIFFQTAAATTNNRKVLTTDVYEHEHEHEHKSWRTLLNASASVSSVTLSLTPIDILPGAYGIISALGNGNTLGVDTHGELGAQATLQIWQNSFATQDWVFTGYNQIALTGNSKTCLCVSSLAKFTGTPVYTDVCDNYDVRQKFTLSSEFFLHSSNSSPGLVYGTISPVSDPSACLDVNREINAPNTPLITFACHPKNTNQKNQKWTLFQAG